MGYSGSVEIKRRKQRDKKQVWYSGDDLSLSAAEALLKQKQSAPSSELIGYSSGKAQFGETPIDPYTVRTTDSMFKNLWGTGENGKA